MDHPVGECIQHLARAHVEVMLPLHPAVKMLTCCSLVQSVKVIKYIINIGQIYLSRAEEHFFWVPYL